LSSLIATLVGSAAAVCSVTSFAPQMVKIWKSRDASSVSLRTYSLTVTCFALWVVYGVMTEVWPVTVANACALLMSAGVLTMKWRFRNGDPALKEDRGSPR
jgi:MtN3 and saliva related transmembrane protein